VITPVDRTSESTVSPGDVGNVPTDGILLVGHGTRDANGTREFFELTARLAEHVAPIPVEGCLLEFQQPTIPEGWHRLVERGVKRVLVTPLLLFAAGHARQDIPEAIAACAEQTPDVSHQQSPPLSRSGPIINLLTQRIDQAARRAGLARDPSTALVMVGRGSHHPCATSDMRVLGEIVGTRVGFSVLDVGFYAMAEPKLPEVLDRVAASPAVRSIVVQPHLLFQGRLFDAIRRQVDEAASRHPDVSFATGDYLGPTEEVAHAIAARAFAPPRP
jgi:sirohydrochlorin cobaltochelatase